MSECKLTNTNFDEEVTSSAIPVLIDFWAEWCGPCRMLSPVISEIAEENEGKIKVCKANVDEEPELAQKFNIRSIPALFVLKEGKITSSAVGYMPKEDVLKMLD